MAENETVVCFPFIGDLVGGSHVSAMGLIRSIDRSRFNPLVVLHLADGPLAILLRREGIAFEAAPVSDYPELAGARDVNAIAKLSRSLPPIVRFLRGRDVKIVHTNDGRVHVTWGIAAKLSGAKLLWHHRSDPHSFGLRWIAPWIADHLVSVSNFASPSARAIFSTAGKCSVVHSPFDTTVGDQLNRETCRARLLAEIGRPPDTLLVGYVGALVDRKRPFVFLEAIAALVKLAPELKVAGVFIGEAQNGLDAAVIKRAAELGVGNQIHLLGFRYPGEPWVAALDVLLVTAVDEPFGRTLIEAMLVGTAVIAADSGGNPEAIQDGKTGLIVPPDDALSFARAVESYLHDPLRKKEIVEAAYRDARMRFGIHKHVTAISDIYNRLLYSRNPS